MKKKSIPFIFVKITAPTLTILGSDGSARGPLPLDAEHRVGRHFVINLFGGKSRGNFRSRRSCRRRRCDSCKQQRDGEGIAERGGDSILFGMGWLVVGIGGLGWNNRVCNWILGVLWLILNYLNII